MRIAPLVDLVNNGPDAPRLQTEKSFFILEMEIVQLCPSPVLPHEISAQNCAGFEAKQKSKSSWTHSNPGTWQRFLILKIAEMENRRASAGPSLGEGLNYFLESFVLCYLEHNFTLSISRKKNAAKTCRRGASVMTHES